MKLYFNNSNKDNEKFYNAVSNYTNLGIKSVNYLFSCAEMITYATFHLTEKSLLFSLSVSKINYCLNYIYNFFIIYFFFYFY